MQMISSRMRFLTLILMFLSPATGFAQTPGSACGSQPFCFETNDFVATVSSFRTSTNNVYKQKIIDATLRFQNKMDRPVVLGYVDHSGLATDEHGNRSIPWGPNAYRGIGLVSGTTFDPKLVVRPGAWGDAQFELVQQGTPQNTGITYVLELTIDEINISGGQPTLGGEFPLHFEGLTSGVSQGVGSLAGAPDGLASAVSNLKSIFGKKKAVQNAATVASSAASTASTVNASANSAAAQPPSAAANTPGPAGSSAKAAPQQVASAPPAAGTPTGQTAGDAEPWTPPADGSKAAPRVAPIKLEPEKMPDVIGVHLGMDPKEAMAIMRSHYPKNRPTTYDTSNLAAFPGPVFQGSYINPVNNQDDNFVFYATLPPEKQLVWKVNRMTKGMHINRQTLLAALRAKYGKESAAFGTDRTIPPSNDAEISLMLWLFDESGHHVPLSNSNARTAMECAAVGPSGVGSSYLMDEAYGTNSNAPLISANPWCKSFYVGVSAEFAVGPIIEMVVTDMMDLPLAVRTSHSTAVWYRAQAERARQQDLEKSKQVKPVF